MENLTLTGEQETELQRFIINQPHGGIVRCYDAPTTITMIRSEKYIGKQITVVRKLVDQLDQITVWWN